MIIGKEPWWKYVLTWPPAVIGGMFFFASFFYLFSDLVETFACFFAGLAIGLPGAWWLYCNHADKKEQRRYEEAVAQAERYRHLLTPEDQAVLYALNTITPPKRKDRAWLPVVLITVAFWGGFLYFAEQSNANHAAETAVTKTPG